MPRFLAAQPDTRLITLPWPTPLADWPEENLRKAEEELAEAERAWRRGVD